MSIEEMIEAAQAHRRAMGRLARIVGRRLECSKRKSSVCQCGCKTPLPQRNEPGQPLRYLNKHHRFRAGNVRKWRAQHGRA